MALSHSRPSRRGTLVVGALATSGALAVAAAPASAAAPSHVRFLHAVPGVGAATLSDGSAQLSGRFAGVTGYRDVPSGSSALTLAPKAGGAALATATEALTPGGHYTVVAVPVKGEVVLRTYADAGSSRPAGSTLLRVVHAAPELGEPDVWLGSTKLAAKVPFEATSGYAAVPGGTTKLALAAPGKRADPLLSAQIDPAAGRPLSVFVVGSRGQAVRAVAVRDVRSTGGRSQATSAASDTTYTMRSGDNLWKVARGRVGAGASDTRVLAELHRIWSKNNDHVPGGDPNVIPTGQRLTL